MAKKKKQNSGKPPQKKGENMVTNMPMKGMVKDVDSSYINNQNWSHARNAINNSIDGDTGVIGNEPANLLCAEIPYTVIGGIHLYGDKWIIFSTDNDTELNDGSSEIGEFDDSTCTYTTLVNDSCLDFHKDNLVIGVAKENFDCGWQIYWDDGKNPSRTLPISKIPYKQWISSPLGPDNTYTGQCVVYEDIIPLQLDCEKIRLAPLLDTPTLTLSKAAEGGQLPNGMYQVFMAYTHNDQVIGDYLGVSNPQPLWSYENNSGSLDLRISNVDKEFEFMQVVVRTRVHNGYSSYILGYYSTETSQINIDYLDPDLEKVKSSRLLLRNPSYEKSDGMYELNDYLIRTQPTEQFDFNYQPLANEIVTEWTSAAYPANYYKNGGNKPTFLRDEVYTFFIRFIYNTGEKSKSYHIPGREAEVNNDLGGILETEPDISDNNFNGEEKIFKVHNTASYSADLLGDPTGDGGIFVSYGKMGYWEAKSEYYPATDPIRWGSLCGKPIRHHKMPTENTHTTTRLSDGQWQLLGGNSADNIYILGAQFSNIAAPIDNQGAIIQNITGYEILVGNRDGNKSIIAKGIIRNMMSYERNEHQRSLDENNYDFPSGDGLSNFIGPIAARTYDMDNATYNPIGQSDINYGLMPNYPYNDTQSDPFLNHRGRGDVDPDYSPWLAGVLDGPPVESNWITGRGSLLSSKTKNASIHYSGEMGAHGGQSRALNEFTRNYHTFHSPDLNFTHMYLAPSELVVYKTLTGIQTGQFIKSEKHPGAKLLKNRAVLVAAIIGVGYALNKMRGKRSIKINTARSQSTGETMAVGSGMTPMPGTGTAAAAVNVLLNIPGVVVGAVSEIAFNTVVDVASIFGAGKLARQIGAPVYQMIEAGTTGLMAGHIGPNKSIEYQGSDFTSVPTLMSMITGILTFLNYVAIGGDKIIDLILAIVDFQDYAYKYNSHGFYSTYNPMISGGPQDDLSVTPNNSGDGTVGGSPSNIFRHDVAKSRYIKQGINYFDGDIPVNNLHRPSTVVIKTASDIDSPSNHGYIDNSKFTIGGGKCAGIFNYTASPPSVDNPSKALSWWTPTGTVSTSIAAQYVGLKVDNDNQYGQLDSILFTPISQPFRFLDSPGVDSQVDITGSTRFYTGPLFGGDTYIARYTEKVTMPFWFEFMKDGPDGLPFDYRYYSNIPFPRYWMNTEKYRMDEFVRPIKDLSFNFDEAFPSDMYHLDSPTLVDCEAINSEYVSDGSGNSTSNYNEDLNFHLEVVTVPASDNIMATLDNRSKAPHWEIAGVARSQFLTHAPENASWYTGTGQSAPVDPDNNPIYEPEREREVACGIQGRHISHGHSTPLIDWGGADCINKKDDWYDFCNPGDDVTPPRKTDIDGRSKQFKALYNWNAGQFVCPVLWRTPSGVIGAPGWNAGNGGPCHHNGICFISGEKQAAGTTLKQCTQLAGGPGSFQAPPGGLAIGLGGQPNMSIPATSSFWIDSCWPEDNPKDFRYYTRKQIKKEKGWFTGSVTLNQGSFNVAGSTSTIGGGSVGGDSDCDGATQDFVRPGSPNRNQVLTTFPNQGAGGCGTGLNPDCNYNNAVHVLIAKGGAPPKSGDIGGTDDNYTDTFDEGTDTKKKTGGLFVETVGYMYTHISGVNDFYVESDMNLSFRDWEDVPRKRHYDNEEFTDVNMLFHADHIQSDNYYKYDQSLNMRRLWTASFGQIQPRYYDPYVSETCFVKYPKRLLYSLPSVGVHTKEMKQFKRDEVADHWRTFLPQNFRDFKSTVKTIVPTDQTGAIILFPTLSPQRFQGVDQINLANSGNKLVIGDGGLFSQAFQNVTNSNVSHEYGSSESSRGVVSTPSGIFFVSQAQGKIFQYGGKGLKAISDVGMKWWFNKYLPSQLLKDFPEAEKYPRIIDNPVVSAGVLAIYDPNNDLVYFSKRDYKAHADKVDDIIINPGGKWYYQGGTGGAGGSSSETNSSAMARMSEGSTGTGGNYQSVEIDVTDTDYFEDVSWTVSYDPKAGAWISFHDWHPELAFNSINHFLTTKEGISSTPICPPEYTYNGTTGECEISAQGSTPATNAQDVILATNNSLSEPATNGSDIIPATNTWVAGGVCVMDIVVSMDWSGSTNTQPGVRAAQLAWLDSFVNNADIQTGLANGDIQIGFCGWGSNSHKSWDETGPNQSNYSMDNQITWSDVLAWYNSNWNGGGTSVSQGLTEGNSLLIDKAGSRLGDRSSQTGYKEVLILVTDTGSPPASNVGVAFQGIGFGTGSNNRPGRELHALYCGGTSSTPTNPQVLDYITCQNGSVNVSGSRQYGIAGNGSNASFQIVANALTGQICQPIGDCTCPPGYVLESSPPCNFGSTPNCRKEGPCTCPSGYVLQPGACDNNNTPDCVFTECDCPTASPAYTFVGTCAPGGNPTCERTICSCASTPGYGTAFNWETGTCGSPTDPLMCNYDFSDSVAPNYDIVGIWRHNSRTDKFANFYGNDYPWEVDLIETSGQQVTTLRSVEYLLESYVYKNDGRDRFHVLDFNFDEAEIYNTEQTSGLLKLNISPKNDAPLITTYPIINANDIDILYSKEEQKYRFNQFWDVTLDRGEFTGVENTIYITRLNGYIKDLNTANINLLKSSFERKKFRHYYNHVVLRRSVSDDKKMLLKLNNTKLNVSMR